MSRLRVSFKLPGGDGPQVAQGRDGWLLLELLKVGEGGLTTLSYPGARISHYAMKLRRMGVPVETIAELHGGDFAGRHGRYRLAGAVQVVSVEGGGANG